MLQRVENPKEAATKEKQLPFCFFNGNINKAQIRAQRIFHSLIVSIFINHYQMVEDKENI